MTMTHIHIPYAYSIRISLIRSVISHMDMDVDMTHSQHTYGYDSFATHLGQFNPSFNPPFANEFARAVRTRAFSLSLSHPGFLVLFLSRLLLPPARILLCVGESDWRHYRNSVLRSLPHKWATRCVCVRERERQCVCVCACARMCVCLCVFEGMCV